jgi:kynurenine formamidase
VGRAARHEEGGAVDRVVDLSHPIEHGMTTYPGIPSPEIGDHLTREASRAHYAPGTEFHFGRISLVGNTGTYIDSPFHRYVDGSDLATTPLERMTALDGVVVTTGQERVIDVGGVRGISVGGRAVLFRTDWSRHWGSDAYFSGHPHLTADAASWLVAEGVTLVGIDSLNIDGTETGERPVHSTLLAAGIPIVEHLCCLDRLPTEGFQFHAAPPGVVGLGTFPVRAYAILNQDSPRQGGAR